MCENRVPQFHEPHELSGGGRLARDAVVVLVLFGSAVLR